ncbi:MAG: hypothetical protein JRN15_16385 [Nitrososphaerota archaeon]|nr:hypothetical protein [Nitrososphaerota archaeon]
MVLGKGQVPLGLLGAFPPNQWTEDLYVRAPPFVIENMPGRIHVIPADSNVQEVLDNVARSVGFVKRKQGHVRYLVSKSDSIKALRLFDWFVRRSWRDKRFAVLWAIIYIGEAKRWSRPNITLESVAEMSDCELKQSAEIMQAILDGVATPSKVVGYTDYELSRERVMAYLMDILKELPTWTDELVMKSLCSGMGGSVEDVYEQIMSQGLGIESAYKVAERLKRSGYLYAARHYRVNERGPMREQLSANCRNCFYGYSSEQRCLTDTLRQIEGLLSTYYGREFSEEEKQSLYASIKLIPLSSRVSRRVLESLWLIHQVQVVTNERRVVNLLKKIEEKCGIELPIKIEDLPATDSE